MNTTTAQAHFHTLDQISGYDYIGEAFEIDAPASDDEVLRYYACPITYRGNPFILLAHVTADERRTYSHISVEDLNRMHAAITSITP